ncbi:PDZ and LIM domain protein Zasp isoform X3 [Aedes aegypti]|uniref:PDZ and LIM domain protein Zasp n=1 Tax=Aedes aegypti TaxID=7159 RepID=A0A6I8U4L8_AEDAE|nr:PDZ and LIM domain protein Zasp isoform X3 [Aedes aegypti]
MANLITVRLQRNEGQPWGFRLQGGKDFSSPLVLQRVNGGSVADQAGLMPGDALVKVNNTDVFNLRHKEAQDVIMAAGNSFELSVSRGTAWRPSVTPTGSIPSPSPSMPGHITPVTKTSLAATPQPAQHIGSGHNQAAKPFPSQQPQEQVNGSEGPIKSIVNKQYNTPVAMYSDETIAETLSSQAEVLAGGVLGVNFKKNERVYSPANSEVYKLLHEQGDEPEPASSHFYATQSHAIGGYATAGRLPVGSLTKPRSPVPPQMLHHPHPQPQTQPQQHHPQQQQQAPHHPLPRPPMMAPSAPAPAQVPAPAPAPVPVRPAPQTAPRAGIPPKIHPDGQKSGVQAISAALNAHANLNGRSHSPYATNHPPPPPLPSSATTTTTTATITLNGGIGSSSTSSTQSPSHSRSSSTTSSSGYCNSSSLSPVQSNKVSPLHSRTSSENELILDPSTTATKLYGVQQPFSEFSYLPPPPPSLLAGLSPTSPVRSSMENPEAVEQQQTQQLPVEAADPGSFGPNGLAVAQDGSADSTDAVTQNDYGFFYKTMGGAVIRSVFPPGASGRYKNQSNITPKPFGASLPMSNLSQVQPPASFPPVAGSVPTPFAAAITSQAPAPAPAPAPMAAAPATQPAVYPPVVAPAPAPVAAAPAAVPTQQGDLSDYEEEEEEEEEQVQKPAESPAPLFTWPPKRPDDEIIPLATPIYIPVPETQKVVVKPVAPPPERPREKSKSKSPPEAQKQQQQQQQQQPPPQEEEEEKQFIKSVQSKSAPELSRRRSDVQQQQQQCQEEESYETYTTTTTSTSASSEEYQMYSTQTSQPIVTLYDTPVMEMDYPFSSGQRSAQASTGAMSDASYTHFVFRDPPMEVNSVEPSVEPSIEPEPERAKSPEVVKPQKRVEFVDYSQELERYLRAEQAAREAAEKQNQVEIEEVTEEFTIPHYELPVIKSPNPMPSLPKPIVPNPVPKQWQSKLVQALCTAPKEPIRLTAEQIEEANFMKSRNEAYVREQHENKMRQLEALKRQVDALERRLDKKKPEPEPEPQPFPPLDIPRKGSVMARILASSTTKSERFPKYLPAPVIPLPEDSAPYFPPPHSMEPIRSEKISSFRASPFLEALTTAPYTPFQKFGTEIPSQMENMPVPSGRLSMTEALATAPERPYTPFTEVQLERSEMYEKLLREQPSIQVDPEKNYSAFASVGGNRTPVPFKPIIPEIREPEEQPAPEPEPEPEPEPVIEEKKPEPEKPKKKLPPYPRKDAGSDHYSLAPRRESKSPLHQPAEIPNYQRKWYNLPTQNPPYTPEPEELRQNVPLAFVDTHSKSHLAKPIAQTVNTVNIRDQVTLKKSQPFTTIQNRTIPVIQTTLEDDAELAQYNNAHIRLQAKGVVDRGQSFTPSMILTKHPTTIPYYQHQLGFEEYFAETKSFDGRHTPIKPARKSPAFGPPPNPLKAFVPPPRDDIPNESGLYLSMGKLTGVPWYAHKDHVPADIQEKMIQQQHGMGGGYGVSKQHKTVSYRETPVTIQTQQRGEMTVQTRSQESAMREQASSVSASQVGNALIQKRTRIVEEHEHSQSAKAVEISKFSSKIKEDEAPQKGYVAQQTRRFSGQDEALNIPSQFQQQEPQTTQQTEPEPQVVQTFPQPMSQPNPSSFPSTATFPEPIVDRFPTKSSRKHSVLLPSTQARSPTPTSGFKAQFNEFMVGSGALPPLTTQREEPEQELVQSWPPQLPSFIPNTNPTTEVRPSQAVAPPAPAVVPSATTNGRRPSNNSITGFSNNSSNSNLMSSQNNHTDRSGASAGSSAFNRGRAACSTTAPTRGRGIMNQAVAPGGRIPLCGCCSQQIRGPFITALGRIWCPDHFICHNGNCKRPLADIGFVEEKGDLYCEYCFEEFLAPVCSKCNTRVKGDCLNAIGKQFHPECFKCAYCGKLFGNSPFFLEEGDPYCEADWNELFTTKCFACGFPVEAGDKWVEALNNNYHSQCFNCTSCKKNLEGQSFFAKGGRPFCKNHAR